MEGMRGSIWIALITLLPSCGDAAGPGANDVSGQDSGTSDGASESGLFESGVSDSSTYDGGSSDSGSSADADTVDGSDVDSAAGEDGSTPPFDAGPFSPPPEDKPDSVEVGVRNLCAFPLWIHAAGNGGVLQPDDAKLESGETRWYDAPEQWSASRITAYLDGPRDNEIEKVEMTFVDQPEGVILNYNLTYVDWVGLPVEIEGLGDGGDCKPAGCYAPRSDILSGCPAGLLDGAKCRALGGYCMNAAHQGEAICTKLDGEVQRCAQTQPGCEGAVGATTADAYACAGFFASSPKWCAALNRGMLDDPDNPDTSQYYINDPYSVYAKWVHQTCPGIYAFPYDDYPSNAGESGFHACGGGRELRVTFCPSG